MKLMHRQFLLDKKWSLATVSYGSAKIICQMVITDMGTKKARAKEKQTRRIPWF